MMDLNALVLWSDSFPIASSALEMGVRLHGNWCLDLSVVSHNKAGGVEQWCGL